MMGYRKESRIVFKKIHYPPPFIKLFYILLFLSQQPIKYFRVTMGEQFRSFLYSTSNSFSLLVRDHPIWCFFKKGVLPSNECISFSPSFGKTRKLKSLLRSPMLQQSRDRIRIRCPPGEKHVFSFFIIALSLSFLLTLIGIILLPFLFIGLIMYGRCRKKIYL